MAGRSAFLLLSEFQLLEVLEALFVIAHQRGNAEHDALRLRLIFSEQVHDLFRAELHLRDEFKVACDCVQPFVEVWQLISPARLVASDL
jgi:hypothetical protein